MSENRLGRETSPYLLQHKDNPVHWRAWNEESLGEAVATGRPILLSVGYAACHWCHVMAHESFENPDIAGLMNELFIPIKVDREERPDIDAIYQHALALLGQQGGWPLTMFLTPDAKPFWGGTYFPPASRWGRPGFADVLRGVADIYGRDEEKIANNVAAIGKGLARLAQPAAAGPVELSALDQAAERFASHADRRNGGLGGAPKFPNPPMLELLWRATDRAGDPLYRDLVLLTLDRMSEGGIYDHLGGGYARYSTDERWLAPHFEKMLYDNAQLVQLLCWAWQATGKPLYKARVEETIGWLLREMRTEGGAFAAALDADSEHEEGKFYVWSEAEVDAVLGPDSAVFKAAYDVTADGNWEGKVILNRLHAAGPGEAVGDEGLARSREKLLAARAGRERPLRDDKVLADWNGLMISALSQASQVFARPEWLAAATEAWRFITGTMTISDGRLRHSWRLGKSHPGTLDDHADMARAALSLHDATGDAAYLDQAIAWVALLDTRFADPAGGYYFAADDTETLIVRAKSVNDGAVPSGNGMALQVLARLHAITGEAAYLATAERLVAAFSGEIERDFFPLPAYLNGIDQLARTVSVAIIGSREEASTRALLDTVGNVALPNLVLSVVAPNDELPPGHPAAGQRQLHGQATAYVCEGRTCSLPLTDPAALRARLLQRRDAA